MRDAAMDELHWHAEGAWNRQRPNWREAALQLYLAVGDTARAAHHWRRCLLALFAPQRLGRGL